MIQKVCAFICFGIVIYITTQSGGWMVKALGFDKEGEGSNPILIMLWSWYQHDDMSMVRQIIISNLPKKKV